MRVYFFPLDRQHLAFPTSPELGPVQVPFALEFELRKQLLYWRVKYEISSQGMFTSYIPDDLDQSIATRHFLEFKDHSKSVG